MNDCFLNLLFSFQLLLPLKDGADFVGSKQTIDVILSDLSLLGYVIPVGGLGIGLFICLLAYLAAEYNGVSSAATPRYVRYGADVTTRRPSSRKPAGNAGGR